MAKFVGCLFGEALLDVGLAQMLTDERLCDRCSINRGEGPENHVKAIKILVTKSINKSVLKSIQEATFNK